MESIIICATIIVLLTAIGYRTGQITKENIVQWLLYQVTLAEKELGSGTGKLKLGQVYDSFVKSYPIISKFITFVTFSKYVDIALERMRQMLAQNNAAKSYVTGL